MVEAAEVVGFEAEEVIGQFLRYTMAGEPSAPSTLVRLYLQVRSAWCLLGRQFLVVARCP